MPKASDRHDCGSHNSRFVQLAPGSPRYRRVARFVDELSVGGQAEVARLRRKMEGRQSDTRAPGLNVFRPPRSGLIAQSYQAK